MIVNAFGYVARGMAATASPIQQTRIALARSTLGGAVWHDTNIDIVVCGLYIVRNESNGKL